MRKESGPPKWLLKLYGNILLAVALVRVPWWILTNLTPSQRPRKSWSIRRCIRVNTLRYTLTHSMNDLMDIPNHLELRLGSGVSGLYVDGTPELIIGIVKEWAEKASVEAVRLPGYWTHKIGENIIMGQEPSDTEKVVYFLHGGGYVHLSAHPDSPTSNIVRSLLKHCPSIRRSFAIEYRLSSITPNPLENPFPAALIDAVAGYAYLVNSVGYDPSNIIVVGDSAGGNLAQALVRYLIDYSGSKKELPAPPGALMLLSPYTDMSGSHHGPGSSVFTNQRSDYLVGPPAPYHIDAPRGFIEPFGLPFASESPYVSPACKTLQNVSFEGFPRTFISSCDGEIILDQIRALYERMKDAMGVDRVAYFEAKDAFHDCLVSAWPEPECSETLKAVSAWVSSL